MAIKIDEFKGYLTIDKNALDDELVQQPSLVFEVSEAYEKAAELRDKLKEELATIDAELDGIVRIELAKKDKVTEAAVKAAIQMHKKHEAAFNAYVKAKTDAGILNGLRESFSTKSKALDGLVELHKSNYFERSSAQGSRSTDEYVYKRRRAQIAGGRKSK